jgi:formylglycine-generating enzyme required for sulfatase activity
MASFKQFFFLIFFLLIILAVCAFVIFYRRHPNSPVTPAVIPVTKPLAKITSPPSKCPPGFIPVPGNQLYQTADFCVMKYDAKCADISDLTKGLEPVPGSKCTSEGTYRNNSPGCACTGRRWIVSAASGFPVTYIAETDSTPDNAVGYCRQLGWHLMTNSEWMTIARNVEQVPDNWCDKDGTNCGHPPGTQGKILANGHNDNSARALVAGNDDQPCFGTTTGGSGQCGAKSSQKRTLTLNNGEIIWDLAGNVWQWIDIQVLRQDQPPSFTGGVLDRGWQWSEFAPGGLKTVISGNGSGPLLGYDSFRPSDPNWNSVNGVGRIYHFSGPKDDNPTAYTFIRGGNWRHGYDSGVFTVHMSPVATKENIDDVGFRCVADLK